MAQCPVCGNQAGNAGYPIGKLIGKLDGKSLDCPQCGKYGLWHSVKNLDNYPKRHVLSWYIRKQNDSGMMPLITSAELERFKNYPEIQLVEKIDVLLLAYANSVASYTQRAEPEDKKFIAQIQARDEDEYHYVLRILEKKGYVHRDTGGVLIQSEGWIHAESLRKKTNSTQAFVAMWFDPSMDDIYKEGIAPAFEDTGMKPFLVSQKEHNNKVDDEIIAEIQRSRFMVADLTGHRPNVYFEAGYAMGRGIPIIWTCKEPENKDEQPHFDIRQYNMIFWKDAEDLRTRLHHRIRATLGEQQ